MAKTRIERAVRRRRGRATRPGPPRARKGQRGRLELLTSQLAASVKALRRAQLMAKLAHVITGPEGRFESWSDTLPELAGIAPGAMPASTRQWLELIHPEDRALFRARCIDAGATHERRDAEYRLRRGGTGAWVHLRQTMEPLDEGARGAGRWFSTLQDITEQKLGAERLTAMARRLATLQEKERRDIARELHDRVGQNLSSLGVNLERLRADSAGRESAARIADCVSIVESTGMMIQDVLTELKPPMLAGYGLIDALRFHAHEFGRRTGLAVTARGPEPALRLEAEIEMALYRIAQAALANAAQHAQARNVRIALDSYGSRVRFEVSDDGIGFDVAAALASGRWGLAAMRERAEAIGGTLEIDSSPGRGTRVAVELGPD